MRAGLLLLIFAACSAHAGEGILNKLLSPGPLMRGHQELEKTACLKCHELNKGVPDAKCLGCHKEIRKGVESKHGFHGRTGQACIKCHSDHKGAAYDSTRVDPESFDHGATGYRLVGKHADLHCHECHKELRAKMAVRKNDVHYLGLAASSCAACHRKDDPHSFTGKAAAGDCDSCHGMASWKKDVKFQHGTDTSYPLEGKHAEVKCLDCHRAKAGGAFRYQFPELKQRQCLTCHRDQHAGKLGQKFQGGDCLKCHSMQTWKPGKFDHAVTGYPLKGKHAAIRCVDCHKQESPKIAAGDFVYKGLKKNCLSCHRNHHQFSAEPGRKLGNLQNCTVCHTETDWKSSFRHDTDTRYEISGRHVGVKCEQCHVPNPQQRQFRLYKWPHLAEKTCETCHKNPHLSSFTRANLAKKCTECHVDTGWDKTRNASFDHEKSTRFPLEGRHKEISCASCHMVNKEKVFRFPSAEKRFCVDCHANPHGKQFSARVPQNDCAQCHDSDTFTKRLPFDHKTTRFPLTGKHGPLQCEECHKPTAETFAAKPHHPMAKFVFGHPQEGFCADCHENVHRSQFHAKFAQMECGHCHATDSFRKRLFFKHQESAFPIRGRHELLRCEKCHVPTQARFPKTNHLMSRFTFEVPGESCSGCHKDPHRGAYGSRCGECHNEQAWKRTGDFHRSFTLSGVHFSLSCAECHKDGRRLAGLSRSCLICHQKDDVHAGGLPNCGDCHRQFFWENPRFNHGLTQFALRGIHRTLDCLSCHSDGVYKGRPSRCSDCHLQQALAFTGSPNHSLLLGRSCNDCHNQFSFR